MKIHRAEKSLRRRLTLISFILGSSIVILSCDTASKFQTSTSTSTIAPTITASLTVSPSPASTETPTQTPMPGPSVLRLQAVLNAVATKLSQCRAHPHSDDPPVMIIETGLEGPSASFTCMTNPDAAYSVSISASDRKAVPDNLFTTEQANNGRRCFHGYILYQQASRLPQKESIVRYFQEWRVQECVVSITAGYDPGRPNYTAQEFSEAVYTFGVEQVLFSVGTCS